MKNLNCLLIIAILCFGITPNDVMAQVVGNTTLTRTDTNISQNRAPDGWSGASDYGMDDSDPKFLDNTVNAGNYTPYDPASVFGVPTTQQLAYIGISNQLSLDPNSFNNAGYIFQTWTGLTPGVTYKYSIETAVLATDVVTPCTNPVFLGLYMDDVLQDENELTFGLPNSQITTFEFTPTSTSAEIKFAVSRHGTCEQSTAVTLLLIKEGSGVLNDGSCNAGTAAPSFN